MLEKLLSVDFLKFALPAAAAVIAWFIDRQQRRSLEEYQRKEERYRELLKALPGFSAARQNPQLKQAFLDQVNLCWLYCSDDVIRKAYAFLALVHTDVQQQPDQATLQKALGEFVVAIRSDLLSRRVVKKTVLTARDFRFLSTT